MLSKLLETASEAVDTIRGQTVVVDGVVETWINKFLPFLRESKQSKKTTYVRHPGLKVISKLCHFFSSCSKVY